MTAEVQLETARRLLANTVLGMQRTYCGWVTKSLQETPEFIDLREATGASDADVRRLALTDQEAIYKETADARASLLEYALTLTLVILLAIGIGVLLSHVVEPVLRWMSAMFDAEVMETYPTVGHLRWRDAMQASGLAPIDLVLGLICGIIWAALGLRALIAGTRATLADLRGFRIFHTAIRSTLHERLQTAYHEVANASNVHILRRRTAPALADLDADQMLDRTELARVRALAFDLGAGAIAISGSRGVGKTTLLNMLGKASGSHGRRALVINVAAPVRYDAREFLLHLYGELTRAALSLLGAPSSSVWLLRTVQGLRTPVANVLFVAAFSFAAFAIVPGLWSLLISWQVPVPGERVLALILAITLWQLARLLGRKERASNNELAVDAQRQLERIRFLQTFAIESQQRDR